MSDVIRAALRESFNLGLIGIEPCGSGQANTQRYTLNGTSGKWIAKHYGDFFRDHLDWVRYECEFLAYLAQAGESVARNVPTIDGCPFAIVDGRPLVVYEWAEGGIEWPTSPANARALGQALARMHVASDDFALKGTERTYDVFALIDKPLELLAPYSAPEVSATLAELCKPIRSAIEAVPKSPPFFGAVHGDIHQGNCHFEADGKLTVFDFALAGVGYRAYDFTGFLWPMRDKTIEDPAMRSCCEAFLVGYEDVRLLEQSERDAISAFVQVRTLWESGDWIESGTGKEHPGEVAKVAPRMVAQFEAWLEMR